MQLTSASVNRSALCSVENVILCIFLLAPAEKKEWNDFDDKRDHQNINMHFTMGTTKKKVHMYKRTICSWNRGQEVWGTKLCMYAQEVFNTLE